MANYLDKGGRNNRIGGIFSVDRALNRPNNNFNTSLPNIEPYTDEGKKWCMHKNIELICLMFLLYIQHVILRKFTKLKIY